MEKKHTEIVQMLKSSLLPEQSDDCLDNKLGVDNYKDHISKIEICLSNTISTLATLDAAHSISKDIVLYTIFVSGEHAVNEVWTSSRTIYCARQLLQVILNRSQFSSLLDLLISYKVNYFLTELKPKLLLSTWKKCPAAVSCFIWIVSNLKFPHLGESITSILPTCLLLVDDHTISNKIKGLKCLHHLSKHVSRTDLIQHGRADVIYNAVEHMIYSRDPEIIPELSKLLVEFLSKTEHFFTTNTLLWTRFDDVLNIWLPSMEMEQSILLREVYIDSLNYMLQAMGLASARWSLKLLRILSEYSEQEHTLNKSLSCLLTFINTTWPKMSSNAYSVCFILMKVVVRIYKKTGTNTSESTEKLLKNCFCSLNKLNNRELNVLINELKGNNEIYNCCSFMFEESN